MTAPKDPNVLRSLRNALEDFARHHPTASEPVAAVIPTWMYDALNAEGSEWFIALRDRGGVFRNDKSGWRV